ncbi:MAG: response regulator [Chloroflexi bacterium]|nr:response regulator [Chloroflexota bacterium]
MQSMFSPHQLPRLLVVDDDAYNIHLLTRIFQRTCHLDTAVDGRQALEMLATNEYDVVLLDIVLPTLTGLDVLKIIRSDKDISELPVILISSITELPEVARGIRLGANDYVSKPVDIDVIQARVNTQVSIKRFMDERRSLIVQLTHANEVKVRMMQVASHDLKNPLSNLKLLMNVMRKQAHDPERIQKLVNMAQDSLDAMLRVVEDFLDSGLDNDSDMQVNLRPYEAMTIVRQVLNQYAVAAYNKNISFHAHNIKGTIMADANRLLQVLSNLVSNAIKYSPRGSTVTLSAEMVNGLWRLHVIDEGPGIPESERPYLFQPFNRHKISTEPTNGETSTGLGLWIVKEMMALQAGQVGVECPATGGSIFWVELPLASRPAEV